MAFIGTLIKKAIEIRHTLESMPAMEEAQRKQLLNLLKKARKTAFGIYYAFDEILESEDPVAAFQQIVPIHDYDVINDRWWEQQRVFPDITWPGKPNYFALTSGTTGKESKRVPVTDEMLQCFRAVSMAQVSSLVNFDLPPEFFEKEILALGSSTDLKENEDGFIEGEISGINASNAPDWFDYFYRPGEEISAIDDWDRRVRAIAKKAPSWDIGALAGIPSWILMMLKEIIQEHRLATIHDIWPNLAIYTTGGVAFEPFRSSFEKLFEREVFIMDTYLASEGFFAYNARPGTHAMRLAYNEQMFFEFVPFDEEGFDETGTLLANPKVLTLDQVTAGKDYALLASTPAGTWRYMIGDTVRFTNHEKAEILITGRTKYFLNVVGSQLSEEKLNAAIKKLGDFFDTEINEFAVAALKDNDGQHYHQWVIGTTDVLPDEETAGQKLDHFLKELNKNYGVARSKALKYIQLKSVEKQQIYDWLEETKKKGGQIKFPKVMVGDQMRDLLQFLS